MRSKNIAKELEFDKKIFFEVVGEDEDFIKYIVGIYINNANDFFIKMQKALKENDCKTIKFLAHGFKGSSKTLAFNKIAFMAEEIEKELCNDISTSNMWNILEAMKDEFSSLQNLIYLDIIRNND